MIGKIILGKIFSTAFCVAAVTVFCAEKVSAQITDVSSTKPKTTVKPKTKPTPKPTPKPTTTKRTTTQKAVTKTSVLLLAVQLRLMTVDEDGRVTEVNPLTSFKMSDRLRLSLKANQRGYLYIIRQSAPDADGEIIFPTQLSNNGSNFIMANLEYVLPSNCPKDLIPNPVDCSLTLFPFKDAPQEYFTIIFTRDSLVDLPNDVQNKRVKLENLMSAGKIPVKTLVGLIEESGQDLVTQQGDSQFAIRLTNINVKDNEEIIETFLLNKAK